MIVPDLWEPLCGFSISAIGAGLTLRYSQRAGLVDVPNHRSSHSVPTPRGGGIALVGSVLVVGAYALAALGEHRDLILDLVGAAIVLLTLIGWLDDRGSMSVAFRLPVHLFCGLVVALLVNIIQPLPGPINIAWLAWWAFWTAASINIVNFMDGIDGMVTCQGVVYGIFLFALLPSDRFGSRFGLLLGAACLGFLLWNWPPARIFMGDVGSGPLGLFFAIGGALALESARVALVFLPLFPLFFDALATLVVRFRKGDNLTEAHRTHLYQRIANGGAGHTVVSLAYALAAAIGALVAVAVKDASAATITAAIFAYVAAVVLAWVLVDARLTRREHAAAP